MELIRTFSFQPIGVDGYLEQQGEFTPRRRDAMPVSRGKKEKVDSLFEERGLPTDRGTTAVYHWITFDMVRDLTENALARAFSDLMSYYRLRERVMLELLIPEEELVILGHPDARDVEEQGVRVAYPTRLVEGVTPYIKQEWVQATYHYDLDYMVDKQVVIDVKPVKETEDNPSYQIKFDYDRPYLTHGYQTNSAQADMVEGIDKTTYERCGINLAQLNHEVVGDHEITLTSWWEHPDIYGSQLYQELILEFLRAHKNHKVNILIPKGDTEHPEWLGYIKFTLIKDDGDFLIFSREPKIKESSIF